MESEDHWLTGREQFAELCNEIWRMPAPTDPEIARMAVELDIEVRHRLGRSLSFKRSLQNGRIAAAARNEGLAYRCQNMRAV